MFAASFREDPAAARRAAAGAISSRRKALTERLECRLSSSRLATVGGRVERVERLGEREGMAFGDERAEAARDAGQLLPLAVSES